MKEPLPFSASDTPRAPRLRTWARRHPFATLAGVLVALALALRLGWGWHSSRRLAAALDDLRRRGEPIALADFVEGELPPGENAWTEYVGAARVLAVSGARSPRQDSIQYAPYAPRGKQWEALATKSEQANGPAFAASRRARGLDRLQFPQSPVPTPNYHLRELGSARALANTLADGAEFAHLRGNDAEAVERLLDGLHLGRVVRQEPTVVSNLIGVGTSAIELDAAQQVVPTLNVGAAGSGTPASPAQARALLAALLDESDTREWLVRSLHRERSAMLSALDQRAAQTWAIRPLSDETAVRWLSDIEHVVESARRENGGQARKALRTMDREREAYAAAISTVAARRNRVPRYSRWFENVLDWEPAGYAQSLEQFHRESAERRITAVMLAARLYRLDHGRWPDVAADLVPKYLDAIPPDPFREDGGPLGYVVLRGALPGGADRPLAFSDAGDPRLDPGGAIDTEPMYGWQQGWHSEPGLPYRQIRQYRDVSFWQPATRRYDEMRRREAEAEAEAARESAPDAVDHDPDQPDAPGDDAEGDGGADRPADQ